MKTISHAVLIMTLSLALVSCSSFEGKRDVAQVQREHEQTDGGEVGNPIKGASKLNLNLVKQINYKKDGLRYIEQNMERRLNIKKGRSYLVVNTKSTWSGTMLIFEGSELVNVTAEGKSVKNPSARPDHLSVYEISNYTDGLKLTAVATLTFLYGAPSNHAEWIDIYLVDSKGEVSALEKEVYDDFTGRVMVPFSFKNHK